MTIRSNARHQARSLVDWYTRTARDLPWRSDSPDPWTVLVSEFLLQQTQVATVATRFDQIMATIPDPSACAGLSDLQLDKLWQGLGYYSRSRNLRRTATVLTNEFGGQIPDNPTDLAALPGIGPYTTGAIMAIAFNQPVVGVDGNIARVSARVLGRQMSVPDAKIAAQDWMAALFGHGSPRVIMQAVMDLGATVCTPRAPSCDDCPLQAHCPAAQWDNPAATPLPKKRTKKKQQSVVHVWITDGEQLFLERRPPGLLGDRPAPLVIESDTPLSEVNVGGQTAPVVAAGEPYRHTFTHLHWDVTPLLVRWHYDTPPGLAHPSDPLPVENIDRAGFPKAFSRGLESLTDNLGRE